MRTYRSLFLIPSLFWINLQLSAQVPHSAQLIIDKIKNLESQKDAKCHATANRLEDFIYGTPLSEEARNIRIEIQKSFVNIVKSKASKLAERRGNDSIYFQDLQFTIDSLIGFGRNKSGEWYLTTPKEQIFIHARDFDHYSSISYAYRSLLSVEQDLMLFNPEQLLSFSNETIEPFYKIINLITLASLKKADLKARNDHSKVVEKHHMVSAWLELFESENLNTNPNSIQLNSENIKVQKSLIYELINQKIQAYQKYNNISSSVFLRNIQVYFAKQMWPSDSLLSVNLKSYYLESLVAFSNALIEESAEKGLKPFIRINQVQKALQNFTPFEVNLFEDVIFFPQLNNQSVTIESYDLDAFRDSGIHWSILKFSLDDLYQRYQFAIDPNAAELIVEGIAQMGVLTLRIAGEYSKSKNKDHLEIADIRHGFEKVQNLLDQYYRQKSKSPINETLAQTLVYETQQSSHSVFENVSQSRGIDFVHKSSDWLNRFIRSYVYSEENRTVKLAIPPAFGGSGVAAIDINNDYKEDILLLSGLGNKLYINSGNGQFVPYENNEILNRYYSDVNSFGEPRQPIVTDFNNDGFKDIIITYVNDIPLVLKNIDGHNFEDVSSQTGFIGHSMVAGPATAFDFDKDGLLDIYIGFFGNYLKGELPTLGRNDQNGDANILYRNTGNFRFEKVEINSGKNSGWTQALGHTDINKDGYQDIIVGNDFGTNEYYIYDEDSQNFIESSRELGTDKPSYTMNVGITDINRDNYPDLYISNIVVMQKDEKYVSPNKDTKMKFDLEKMANIRTLEANDFFVSNGNKKFNQFDNIGRGYSSTGWSWDADFFDYDNDGDEDMYCLNGMNDFSVYSSENSYYFSDESKTNQEVIFAQSHKEKNVFFENISGQLINKAEKLGLDYLSNSRSAAFTDIDNDGDLDIIINNYHDNCILAENKTANKNNWVKILLKGDPKKNINLDAIGAVITISSENHKNIWREIHSTDGYLSCHPRTQYFGINADNFVNLSVSWPNGEHFLISNIEANKYYEIKYPNKLKTIKP